MAGKLRSDDLRLVALSEPEATHSADAPQIESRTLAIEVTNATLHYPLGPMTKGSLKTNLFRLFGAKNTTPKQTYVDAVKDLSFDIGFGERVAIIGRNGSGKSTLLRALGGIYPLKSGSVRVTGQIGTLLDVQLGFEPESTGRENIYYRGMAMGYSRKHLRTVEKEIIAFADLGEFIDLPMRTYSTGMYVRLGFAVSTQFQPDILLIDEVFGAGDASFALRAIERMNTIVKHAGILVMATHDMGLVQKICTRVLWLDRGKIVRDGPPHAVVPVYLQHAGGEYEI